jgi:hypothetical protein
MAMDPRRRRWLEIVGVAVILGTMAMPVARRSRTSSGPVVTGRVTETGYEYQVVQTAQPRVSMPAMIGFGILVVVIGLKLTRHEHQDEPTGLSLNDRPGAAPRAERRAV